MVNRGTVWRGGADVAEVRGKATCGKKGQWWIPCRPRADGVLHFRRRKAECGTEVCEHVVLNVFLEKSIVYHHRGSMTVRYGVDRLCSELDEENI